MHQSYDESNLFAKILRNEIPAIRVYEDADVVAFMDVMPQGPGHTLIIPRNGSRNILDADATTLGRTILAVQKLAKATKQAMNADGITILQFNEPAAGQTVFHLHFHVIPRFNGIELKHHNDKMEDLSELENNAKKIRAALIAIAP